MNISLHLITKCCEITKGISKITYFFNWLKANTLIKA